MDIIKNPVFYCQPLTITCGVWENAAHVANNICATGGYITYNKYVHLLFLMVLVTKLNLFEHAS